MRAPRSRRSSASSSPPCRTAHRAGAAGRRKLVLATSIAETSLTIEGVRIVIDSGLARVPRYDPDIGLTRLETLRVSRAAADQRRGRAGRTEPGICYRLWDEPQTAALAAYTQPEILAADLASLALDLANGASPIPQPVVPRPAARAGTEGGEEPAGGARRARCRRPHHRRGQGLRALALPPRLARMIVDSDRFGAGANAAEIAALLTERGLGGDSVDLDHRLDHSAATARSAPQRPDLARRWASQVASSSPPESEELSTGMMLALPSPIVWRKSRQWQLRARQWPRRRGRADIVARARALCRGRRTHRHGSGRPHPAGGAIRRTRSKLRFADHIEARTKSFSIARACPARAPQKDASCHLAVGSAAFVVALGGHRARLRRRSDRRRPRQIAVVEISKQWRDRVMFLRKAEARAGPICPTMGYRERRGVAGARALRQDFAEGFFRRRSVGGAADVVPWELRARLEREAPTHFEAPTGTML